MQLSCQGVELERCSQHCLRSPSCSISEQKAVKLNTGSVKVVVGSVCVPRRFGSVAVKRFHSDPAGQSGADLSE